MPCQSPPSKRRLPWRQIPVFLSRKFHGQRSLASSWDHKESDKHNRDTNIENRFVNTGGEEKGRTK